MNMTIDEWVERASNPSNTLRSIKEAIPLVNSFKPYWWVPAELEDLVQDFDHIGVPATPGSLHQLLQYTAGKYFQITCLPSQVATKEFDNDVTLYKVTGGLPLNVEVISAAREPYNIPPHVAFSLKDPDHFDMIIDYYSRELDIHPPAFMQDIMFNSSEKCYVLYLDDLTPGAVRTEYCYYQR